MKKPLIALSVLLIVSVLALCSCGSKTEEVANHERPVFNLCYSINHNDSRTYLSCFVPAARKAFLKSDSSNNKDTVSELLEKSGIEASDIHCEIIGKRELASADRERLQKDYKKAFSRNDEFDKAFQLDVCFTSSKGTDMRRINVVLIESSWYICSDVIDSFRFGESGSPDSAGSTDSTSSTDSSNKD